METGEASLAGEELPHGGLLEVALLGDEPVQPTQERIHITQRRRDGALLGDVSWQCYGFKVKVISIDTGNATLAAEGMKIEAMQQMEDERWVIAVEITDLERRVQRPERLCNEKYFSDSAVSSRDDARRIHHRSIVMVGNTG